MHIDATLKLMLDEPERLLEQLLGKAVRVRRVLPTELPKANSMRPDLLFELADGGLLHLELQAQAESEFAYRELHYWLRIRERYGRGPEQVVLWVGRGAVGVAAIHLDLHPPKVHLCPPVRGVPRLAHLRRNLL